MISLRRTAYNAARRAERAVGLCASVPFIFRASNQLGWERVGFYYTHRQHGEQHVLPLNDLRPHEELTTCWCGPVEYEPGTWGHYALDQRELVEQGDRMIQ